jgi:hypothetical protein
MDSLLQSHCFLNQRHHSLVGHQLHTRLARHQNSCWSRVCDWYSYSYLLGGAGYISVSPARGFIETISLSLVPIPCFNVSLWWQSTLTGMGLTLLCSIFLVKIARAYQRQANPTKVFSTEGSAEAEPNK